MMDKKQLVGKQILFRLNTTTNTNVFRGTVKSAEPDGLWIESSSLLAEAAKSEKGVLGLRMPVLFVPIQSLLFLILAQG
jgi:hypothetical protein